MPGGIPVGTLAIGKPGAINAGLFAAAILANNDATLADRLDAWREKQTADVAAEPQWPHFLPAPPSAYWAAVNSAECWRWQRLSLAIAAIFMHRKKRASPLRSRPNGPAPAMTTSQHSAPSLRKWPSSLTSLKILIMPLSPHWTRAQLRSEEHTSELQSLMRI